MITMCECCKELWHEENLIEIPLVKHNLYLCPDCYAEYKEANQKLKAVSIGTYEQIKWERDVAIEELGYGLDKKQKTDILDKIRNEITMLVSFNRQNVIEIIDKYRQEE